MLGKRNFSLTNQNTDESTENQNQEKPNKRIKVSDYLDIKQEDQEEEKEPTQLLMSLRDQCFNINLENIDMENQYDQNDDHFEEEQQDELNLIIGDENEQEPIEHRSTCDQENAIDLDRVQIVGQSLQNQRTLLEIKQEQYQTEIIDNWLKEVQTDDRMELNKPQTYKLNLQLQDPSLIYTQGRTNLEEKRIGNKFQATRYPVIKNTKQWNFNYAAEEKKIFKGELMWNPHILSQEQVEAYLKEVSEKMPRKTGMREEIALKFLVNQNYDINKALRKLKDSQEEVKLLIKQITKHEAKIELFGYIIGLIENVDCSSYIEK